LTGEYGIGTRADTITKDLTLKAPESLKRNAVNKEVLRRQLL